MRTAEQGDVMLVRANRVPLEGKPLCDLRSGLLNDRRHHLIPQRLTVFHRKHHVVMDLPRTVRALSDPLLPLVRHTPEGTREPYPRSKLRGITS